MRLNQQLTGESFENILHAILAVCQPKAVILFGSYARGDVHQYSDVDLLVIRQNEFHPGESRRRELGRIYRSVSQVCDIPKDIILFTDNEFKSWRNTSNHMASLAWKEGKIIYGKV
jgi:predicted nucleotidyltransferase